MGYMGDLIRIYPKPYSIYLRGTIDHKPSQDLNRNPAPDNLPGTAPPRESWKNTDVVAESHRYYLCQRLFVDSPLSTLLRTSQAALHGEMPLSRCRSWSVGRELILKHAVWGSGFRVCCSGVGFRPSTLNPKRSGSRVQGFGQNWRP